MIRWECEHRHKRLEGSFCLTCRQVGRRLADVDLRVGAVRPYRLRLQQRQGGVRCTQGVGRAADSQLDSRSVVLLACGLAGEDAAYLVLATRRVTGLRSTDECRQRLFLRSEPGSCVGFLACQQYRDRARRAAIRASAGVVDGITQATIPERHLRTGGQNPGT